MILVNLAVDHRKRSKDNPLAYQRAYSKMRRWKNPEAARSRSNAASKVYNERWSITRAPVRVGSIIDTEGDPDVPAVAVLAGTPHPAIARLFGYDSASEQSVLEIAIEAAWVTRAGPCVSLRDMSPEKQEEMRRLYSRPAVPCLAPKGAA